jgi:aspartate racemase
MKLAFFMLEKQEKVVGILGGMGPEATVDPMRRIIRNTPAEDDIDHICCIVDNNPKVRRRGSFGQSRGSAGQDKQLKLASRLSLG